VFIVTGLTPPVSTTLNPTFEVKGTKSRFAARLA
jgi:hypothetical protein